MRVIKKSAEEDDAADLGYHGVPIAGLHVENISAVLAAKSITPIAGGSFLVGA